MLDYAWLMLVFPALGTLIIALFGTRLGKRVVGVLAPAMVFLSFGVAVAIFAAMLGLPVEGRRHEIVLWQWMATGTFSVDVALLLDQLSVTMALVVTAVGFLIHVYAVGYMHDDPRFPRFFAFLNFFILMMLTLVLANNYLLLYVGWEGVGLASYLLIGFYFEKPAAADAGKKAFIVNRIGDFGLALAIMFIWTTLGTLQFGDVFQRAPLIWGAGSAVAVTVTMLLLLAATGKSAQIPLFVWLPDAMEGPTPVSALIHAATMVTAGVYMIARSAVLFGLAPSSQGWVAWIGMLTALLAATIALTQTDLKRILAYSTISQLGYMFAALGIGAYIAATFHLLTHAFFKALLFLGSGSVIHGMEHGHHHSLHHSQAAGHDSQPFDPQDMRNMGGLFRKMPGTALTFIIGGMALSGFPIITAGFWSKDEILADAWAHNQLVFVVLALAALLTAFYTMRQIMMTFFGAPRTEAAHHASEHDSIFRWMVIPLVALAVFAVAGGWVGIPKGFPVLGAFSTNPFHHYMGSLAESFHIHAAELPFSAIPLATSLVVALGGLFLGWLVYRGYASRGVRPGQSPLTLIDPMERPLGKLYPVLQNKYYFDEFYHKVFIKGTQRLANALFRFDSNIIDDTIVDGVGWLGRKLSEFGHWFDEHIVDGVVNGVGAVADSFGAALRTIQTGKAQNYLLVGLAAVSILLGAFLLLPK